MYTKKELSRDISKLVLKGYSFYSSILFRLRIELTDEIETACTDGKSVQINPTFFSNLNEQERRFVLVHEVLHVALLHVARLNGRNAEQWNIAADYAINGLLANDSRLTMPRGGLYDKSYVGMSAEQIYSMLPPEKDSDYKNCATGFFKAAKNEEEARQMEQSIKAAVCEARTIAKMTGDRSIDRINSILDELFVIRIPWQEVLADCIADVSKNDYNWNYRNLQYGNIYLPATHNEEKAVCIAVDQSASMSNAQIRAILSDVYDIAQRNGYITGTLIAFDTTAEIICELDDMDYIHTTTRQKSGGTSFKCIFECIERENIECNILIVISDMYAYCDYGDLVDSPLVFVSTEKSDYNEKHAKYGKVVEI